jgi:response regulator of citrate/malate metabolism
MRDDPLYVQIKKVLKPGDLPRTAQEIATAFDRSEVQAQRVLEWMAHDEKPPSMAEVAHSSPKQWKRV